MIQNKTVSLYLIISETWRIGELIVKNTVFDIHAVLLQIMRVFEKRTYGENFWRHSSRICTASYRKSYSTEIKQSMGRSIYQKHENTQFIKNDKMV